MTIQELTEHKIGILGFGQEGQAVWQYLQKHNLTATIFDESTDPESFNRIDECSILFRSPGIRRNHPKILKAEQQGTIITSQTKWFFDNCPSKIVGVTGTKGKGTTCSLIFEGLQNNFPTPRGRAYLTGNIGKQQPLEFLDRLKAEDVIVYELSSFQLQDLTISPQIGICLMVTSDHLNHHSNLKEYHEAKAAISAFQSAADICIYNLDYEASAKIGQQGLGKKLAVSANLKPDQGAFISEQNIIISISNKEDYVIDCVNRKLRGNHNLENIAAASLALTELGLSNEAVTQTVLDFNGLEHRLQFIGQFKGVSFYDDSISTVPDTTIAAMRSFTEPIHLFLGGSDKGLDYSSLVLSVKNQTNIASITLLGETGTTIKSVLEKAQVSTEIFGPYADFPRAVKDTVERANKGDVVLLSPAAASFDMFKDYADRGKQFTQIVRELEG